MCSTHAPRLEWGLPPLVMPAPVMYGKEAAVTWVNDTHAAHIETDRIW